MPILDQGYQHWTGTLSGGSWRWLAITRHGLRIALRGWVMRITLIVALLPAIALVCAVCAWSLLEQQSALIESVKPLLGFLNPEMLVDPRAHRMEAWTLSYSRFLTTQLYISMFLILVAGPNLISQDLRFNALPLYLSRPLRRIDYFLGKLGVIVVLIGAVTVAPVIVAYVLGLLFSLDLTILRDTFGLLLASTAYGLLIAISAGMLILALSSLSRNSRYIALAWLALWTGSAAVAAVLDGIDSDQRVRAAWTPDGQFDAQKFAELELASARTNWRPLASYTGNLSRIGQQLLGSDAAWESLSKLLPGSERSTYLHSMRGPQYPWQWSAGILAAVFGLSAWILNRSVRSLDRLK